MSDLDFEFMVELKLEDIQFKLDKILKILGADQDVKEGE